MVRLPAGYRYIIFILFGIMSGSGVAQAEVSYEVTFNLGDAGTLVHGDLVQQVNHGQAAIPPRFSVQPDLSFVGWSERLVDVQQSMTVEAIYHPTDRTKTVTTSLREEDLTLNSYYGSACAMSGDTLVVGASGRSRVYVYIRDVNGDWVKQSELSATAGATNFGSSVAIEGDRLLVGASSDESQRGSVFVFERIGGEWLETQKIVPSDYTPPAEGTFETRGPYFGASVCLMGDVLVASAGGSLGSSAYVYVFQGGEWVEAKKLLPIDKDAEPGPNFGIVSNPSIALLEGRIVLGVVEYEAVYIYEQDVDQWETYQEIDISIPTSGWGIYQSTQFGGCVSMSGDLLAVGASLDDEIGINFGSVYLYQLNAGNWELLKKIYAQDPSAHHSFGRNIEFDGSTLVANAVYVDERGFSNNVVQIFGNSGAGIPDSYLNSIGILSTGADLYLSGDILLEGYTSYFYDRGLLRIHDLGVAAAWVTFDLGGKSQRVRGGELVQFVAIGDSAEEPEIIENSGWVFNGWDSDFSAVAEELNVVATYYDSSSADGDLIWDGWELNHFSSLNEANNSSDADGDRISDFDEFIYGTDPNDPSDFAQIEYFKKLSYSNAFHLRFRSNSDLVDRRYRILYTTDLSSDIWSFVLVNELTPDRDSDFTTYTFPPPGMEGSYFFKVEAFIKN